jgi:hypothetical protein
MIAMNDSESSISSDHGMGASSPLKSRYYRVDKRYSDFLALHNDVSHF